MHPPHRSKLAELNQEVLAVQECYISVCKEKDKLEENLQSRIDEERKLKDNEVMFYMVLCHIAELHVYISLRYNCISAKMESEHFLYFVLLR